MFTLDVSYAQIAVFDSQLANPFNDWEDGHVLQGFSWRVGSVAFATLDAVGSIEVSVSRGAFVDVGRSGLVREILVPFVVPQHGAIEVATISGGVSVEMPGGAYGLTFSHGRSSEGGMWASLNFEPSVAIVQPAIKRADSALSPPLTLLMTARPA